MESIHVLISRNRPDDLIFINLSRKWELYKDSIYRIIRIQFLYKLYKLLFCRILRQFICP